jgi:hydroxypyruvate reductase
LQALNRWLLGSGLAIDAVNRVRCAVSRIKGGRLVKYLEGRHADVLLMTDVPSNEPSQVGSGLLIPPDRRPLPALPEDFAGLPRSEPETAQAFSNVTVSVIASNAQLLEAVARAAQASVPHVNVNAALPAPDAIGCGQQLANSLIAAQPGLYIWGGETVVTLPAAPGRGGRNQALALSAARYLRGHDNCWLLAVGTDGSDGNTSDAGALVDGQTVQRGRDAGLDPDDCLRRADSGSFLEASGDLVHTGPTGTNVMDLIIGYKQAG